jgi:hypothetical protein
MVRGSKVVQLYVHDEASTLIRPPQELKAFAKVTLQPGQAQTVSLTLGIRAFAAYDDLRRAWVAEAGRFEVRLGASSADIPPARLGDAVDRMGRVGQPRPMLTATAVMRAPMPTQPKIVNCWR